MSTITHPPQRTHSQRMQAIQRANEVRVARAETKRQLKAGRISIHDLIDQPPELMRGARVEDTLLVLPRWGHKKVEALLNRHFISGRRTLAGLTPRQREALHRALNEGAGR